MKHRLLWLQLIIGWLPVGALFTTLIMFAHQVPFTNAAPVALRMMVAAALLGMLVRRLAERLPWPHPFRLRFIAAHVALAVAYSAAWILVNSLFESIVRQRILIVMGPGLIPFLVLGVWLYVMVAGITYANLAAGRAARAETLAARSQLAALRAQLNPHFLFNALHTVVQLIPREPVRAAQAAEQIGDLLRRSIEEDRDLVPLAEERAFVERYLEVERLRFGSRLQVSIDIDDSAAAAFIPCFALLTLVENAVRHSVEPRVEPTTISVRARMERGLLLATVHDTGTGMESKLPGASEGTGLKRLRERLAALYGADGRLELENTIAGSHAGFSARLVVPQGSAYP